MRKTHSKPQQGFLDKYAIHRKNEDSDETILRDKQTGEFVLMKQVMLTSGDEFRRVVETLEAQKELSHEHLLALIDYQAACEYDEETGAAHHRITTFFQYSSHNLLQEIDCRYDEGGRLFEEHELWNILTSTVLALAYLQRQAVGHGCLSPIDIFIAADGTVRIVDPSIASSPPFEIQPGYYYAPQVLQDHSSRPGLGIFKSDVFSLAMCLLHAATLESADDCYDYENGEIELTNLESKLELLNGQYSAEFSNLLIEMLAQDPENRPDFLDLEDRLSRADESQNFQSPSMSLSQQFSALTNSTNRYNKIAQVRQQGATPLAMDPQQPYAELAGAPFPDTSEYQNIDQNDSEKPQDGFNQLLNNHIAMKRSLRCHNLNNFGTLSISRGEQVSSVVGEHPPEEVLQRVVRVERAERQYHQPHHQPQQQHMNDHTFSASSDYLFTEQPNKSSYRQEDSKSNFLQKYDLIQAEPVSTPPQSILKTMENLSFNKKASEVASKDVLTKEIPVKQIPFIINPLDKSSFTSGYPVGNSSSLFTDPALLEMVRMDVNKIMSKSHVNKENLMLN